MILPHDFLTYVSILEDMLNPDLVGRNDVNFDVFIEMIEIFLKHGQELLLLHSTYPPIPRMDFTIQYELLKQRQTENSQTEEIIYIREGGFLRLMLKFIFLALNMKPLSRLLIILKTLLTAGNDSASFLQLNYLQKQASDKILSDYLTEKISSYTLKFTSNGDLIFSEEFLSFYILTELTEILNTTADQHLIDFTLLFIQDTNIDK